MDYQIVTQAVALTFLDCGGVISWSFNTWSGVQVNKIKASSFKKWLSTTYLSSKLWLIPKVLSKPYSLQGDCGCSQLKALDLPANHKQVLLC